MDEEEKYWRDFEKVYVHNVYECISSKIDEFEEISKNNPKKANSHSTDLAIENGTSINSKDNLLTAQNKDGLENKLRIKNEKSHQPWPKVKKFLLKLEPNSLIADIGCGEGKYLNINTQSFTIGCDRSISLAKLATFRHEQALNQNQVTICDNLSLPYRSDLFDAVISIGVIHHISTHKRRVKAVQELNRILTTGGKLMIYVWAMEQRIRKFNSQDVLVPTLSTSFKKKTKSINEETEKTYQEISNSSANSEESNDEAYSNSSAENIKKNNPTNVTTKKDLDSSKEKETILNDKIEESEKTICPASTETITNDNLTENGEKMNKNLVQNFRNFFANRFSAKKHELKPQLSLGMNIKGFKEQRSLSSSSSKWLSDRLTQKYSFDSSKRSRPILLTRQDNVDSSLSNLSSSIERYKQIIEDHKDLLPKNFTIRQFPYSSCQDTFDDEDTDLNDDSKTTNMPLDLENTSLPILPLPLNEKNTNGSKENDILSSSNEYIKKETLDNSNELELSGKNILAISNDEKSVNVDFKFDLMNKNKRYYHVFKENELNDLVKESCPNLSIYDSYYDHGNWVICAQKESN